jgi:hypothetical protein
LEYFIFSNGKALHQRKELSTGDIIRLEAKEQSAEPVTVDKIIVKIHSFINRILRQEVYKQIHEILMIK